MSLKTGAATDPPSRAPDFGSSITTMITYFGSFAGANPTNDEVYLLRSTRFVLGSNFQAVPVLPADVYPSGCARLPVPLSTTWRSIVRRSAAVSRETTCD